MSAGVQSDGAVSELCRELEDVATGIETSELPGGCAAVDFSLYGLTDFERAGQSDDVTDQGLETGRSVLAEKGYATKENGEEISADELRSGNSTDVSTQRSGGMFKSSIILKAGTVVEFNFRYPPIDEGGQSQIIAHRRLTRVMERAARQSPGDTFAPHCIVRKNIPDDLREELGGLVEVDGDAYGETELCPHIRDDDCAQPPERIVSYLKRTITEYGREFGDAREWATEAGEPAHPETAEEIGAARERLATIAPGSTIEAAEAGGVNYRITLPPYPADEYGLILLRRAIDHVTDGQGLFPEGEREVETVGDSYHVEIHADSCSRAAADVVQDAETLVEHGSTVDERSRLSTPA